MRPRCLGVVMGQRRWASEMVRDKDMVGLMGEQEGVVVNGGVGSERQY